MYECEFSKEILQIKHKTKKIIQKTISKKSKKNIENYTPKEIKEEINKLQIFMNELTEMPEKRVTKIPQTGLEKFGESVLSNLEWNGLKMVIQSRLIFFYEKYVKMLENKKVKNR